ncbi:MAG: hypothetical protein FD166_5 [Bacteroidetes bacterium]|jgi:acylphosphatase|nr:MAG: hypothetical protein FD166_5 [Bacteroidota bacterium]
MITYSEISFIRKSYEDGFGFACMKAAYGFGIRGRMDYGPETGVKILAEGEHDQISDFVNWIRTNIKDVNHLLFLTTINYSGKYQEFDIYRHTS